MGCFCGQSLNSVHTWMGIIIPILITAVVGGIAWAVQAEQKPTPTEKALKIWKEQRRPAADWSGGEWGGDGGGCC